MQKLNCEVWTGNEMIVWGGYPFFVSAGSYNPSTDSWTALTGVDAPSVRDMPTGVWTGSNMIVWGGLDNTQWYNTGGKYNPGIENWTATTISSAPPALAAHTAVLTGSEMIVWGGFDENLESVNVGGRYCLQSRVPVNISGGVAYCVNPIASPVSDVTFALSGESIGSTESDASGNYQFSSLISGGTYAVTPSKPARTPGSLGITTVDVLATQRHFLQLALLTGCRLAAADANGDGNVTILDVLAISRFYGGFTTRTAHAGQYQFIPTSRSYSAIPSSQGSQDYNAVVLGDVAPPFVE